ncbi:hypothetical protein RFI_03020, partial [Reticulomyxa filosa]
MAKKHIWNMKYLKVFKWHHLLEHKEQMRILECKKFEKAISDANYFKHKLKKSQELKDTFVLLFLLKGYLEVFMPSDGEEDYEAIAADDVIAPGDKHKSADVKLAQLAKKLKFMDKSKKNVKPKSWIYSKSQLYRKNPLGVIDFLYLLHNLLCIFYYYSLLKTKKQNNQNAFFNTHYANFQFVVINHNINNFMRLSKYFIMKKKK